jgi:hypothetical protein
MITSTARSSAEVKGFKAPLNTESTSPAQDVVA